MVPHQSKKPGILEGNTADQQLSLQVAEVKLLRNVNRGIRGSFSLVVSPSPLPDKQVDYRDPDGRHQCTGEVDKVR